jgi:hypothetical protein
MDFVFSITNTPTDFGKATENICEDYIISSTKSFAKHRFADIHKAELTDDWKLEYIIKQNDSPEVHIIDCRRRGETEADHDFIIKRKKQSINSKLRVSIDGKLAIADGIGAIQDIRWLESNLEWILPIEVSNTKSSTVSPLISRLSELTEYQNRELHPKVILPSDRITQLTESDIYVGEVDRISSNENPIVEHKDGHRLLDMGETGEVYVILKSDQVHDRTIARLF